MRACIAPWCICAAFVAGVDLLFGVTGSAQRACAAVLLTAALALLVLRPGRLRERALRDLEGRFALRHALMAVAPSMAAFLPMSILLANLVNGVSGDRSTRSAMTTSNVIWGLLYCAAAPADVVWQAGKSRLTGLPVPRRLTSLTRLSRSCAWLALVAAYAAALIALAGCVVSAWLISFVGATAAGTATFFASAVLLTASAWCIDVLWPQAERRTTPATAPTSVYLRGFATDGAVLNRNNDEEHLAEALQHNLPLRCIGMPGELVPPRGGERVYVGPGADWLAVARRLVDGAELVVVRASVGSGLLDEMELLARLEQAKRVLLYVPVSLHGARRLTAEFEAFGAALEARGIGWRLPPQHRRADFYELGGDGRFAPLLLGRWRRLALNRFLLDTYRGRFVRAALHAWLRRHGLLRSRRPASLAVWWFTAVTWLSRAMVVAVAVLLVWSLATDR